SGNSMTPCMSDNRGGHLTGYARVSRYHADAVTAATLLTAAGTHVIFAGAPPGHPASPEGHDILDMYRTLPTTMAGVSFANSGQSVLNPDGTWTATLPCLDLEGPAQGCVNGQIRVRADDTLHFCPATRAHPLDPCPVWASGAYRYGRAMARPVEPWLTTA